MLLIVLSFFANKLLTQCKNVLLFFSNSITYFIEKYQSRRYRRRGIAAGTAVVWPVLDLLDALSQICLRFVIKILKRKKVLQFVKISKQYVSFVHRGRAGQTTAVLAATPCRRYRWIHEVPRPNLIFRNANGNQCRTMDQSS